MEPQVNNRPKDKVKWRRLLCTGHGKHTAGLPGLCKEVKAECRERMCTWEREGGPGERTFMRVHG